jgi:hypothetical protein
LLRADAGASILYAAVAALCPLWPDNPCSSSFVVVDPSSTN